MEKNDIILKVSKALKEELDFWFRYNNISREKVTLFHDFIISLDSVIESTYLGSDVMNTESVNKEHFSWCWKKTIDNFSKERIFFKEIGIHFEYLWNFYNEAFYNQKMLNKDVITHEYYYKIFDLNHQKTKTELDILITIYKIFDQNLKK
jgi:hypothetical protein